MIIVRLLAGALLALVLPVVAACSSSGGTVDAPSPGSTLGAQPTGGGDLDGTSWVLTQGVGPSEDVESAGITLEFGDGSASGSGGVNRYSGTYTATVEGSLQLGPLAVTEMAGPPEAMSLEQEYLTALQQTFGFTEGEGTLTLFGAADQVLVFRAA